MKRANPYSDGYDGEYKKKHKIIIPTIGIFLFTRIKCKHINNLVSKDNLLTVFAQLDCVTLLRRAAQVCTYWHDIISDPNNQKGIFYRPIQERRIDIQYIKGYLESALIFCENPSNETEYFKKRHEEITRDILQSTEMVNLFNKYLQENVTNCLSYDPNSLCNNRLQPKDLKQLQKSIDFIIVKILDFIYEDNARFYKGFPSIIASFLQKLLHIFNAKGKVKVLKSFQFFLKIRHSIFINLVQVKYICYLTIVNHLCMDSVIDVKKEAALVAALMAIRFPSHQEAWTLFLDTVQSNPPITQYLAETIDHNHQPNSYRVLDIPNRMALLLASNYHPFTSYLCNNLHKFIGFLEKLSSSDTLSTKASAIIALSMITFNFEITCINRKKSAINLIQNELEKDKYLPLKIKNILSNSFFHVNITNFINKLKITFPALKLID